MSWYIFRKDLQRLWPYAVGLAALHLLLATIHVALGDFPTENSSLNRLTDILSGLSTLLIFFAAVLVVQLDPLPDDRQDWLARPIRRRDLLGAKLLFMALAVHLPMFAADLIQGLATGFPPGQALAAAGWWNLYQFVGLTLPSLALATLTRTIGQTLGLALAIAVITLAISYGPTLTGIGLGNLPTAPAGLGATLAAWVLRYALLLAGAAAILGLQYFRRRTFPARIMLVVIAVLIGVSQGLLPPGAALAMQNWGAPEQTVTLAFAPQAGKYVSRRPNESFPFRNQGVPLLLPLKVEGLAPGLMLVSEGERVVVTAPDGGSTNGVHVQDTILRAPGLPTYYQTLSVPRAFLRAHAGQKMRVDITFTLGILRPGPPQTMPADGGHLWLAEGAHCASRIDAEATRVQVSCRQAGNVHQRAVAMLMDHDRPLRWSMRHLPSDAPYSNGADMITRFYQSLPFDGLGTVQTTPTVAMTMAQPVAHIVRHISIPDVRLEDWTAQSTHEGDEQ